jgi:hypothetical protein
LTWSKASQVSSSDRLIIKSIDHLDEALVPRLNTNIN